MLDYAAFSGVRKVLDQVLESDSGKLEIKFRDWNALVAFRHQIYKCRKLDHEQSKQAYAPGEPGWDTSPYDDVTTSTDTSDGFRLRIERTVQGLPAGILSVEELK